MVKKYCMHRRNTSINLLELIRNVNNNKKNKKNKTNELNINKTPTTEEAYIRHGTRCCKRWRGRIIL